MAVRILREYGSYLLSNNNFETVRFSTHPFFEPFTSVSVYRAYQPPWQVDLQIPQVDLYFGGFFGHETVPSIVDALRLQLNGVYLGPNCCKGLFFRVKERRVPVVSEVIQQKLIHALCWKKYGIKCVLPSTTIMLLNIYNLDVRAKHWSAYP